MILVLKFLVNIENPPALPIVKQEAGPMMYACYPGAIDILAFEIEHSGSTIAD